MTEFEEKRALAGSGPTTPCTFTRMVMKGKSLSRAEQYFRRFSGPSVESFAAQVSPRSESSMFDLLRLLLIPLIAAGAWLTSRRQPEVARVSARGWGMALAALLGASALSGLWGPNGEAAAWHRWPADALTMLIWLAAPWAAGVAAQSHFRQRPLNTTVQVAAFALVVVLVTLTSWTGYAGPSSAAAEGEIVPPEQLARFRTLHMLVLPGFIAFLLGQWIWYFRRRRASDLNTLPLLVPADDVSPDAAV
jgi:hypothetical protein